MSGGNKKSLMYTIKHRDPSGIGISSKITQSESQKIDFILPILDYLLIHKKFYATELKQQFDNFNHKSIDRTILLLKKRNLIILHKIELKNKKIYKIKSLKEIKKYYLDLTEYKKFKIFLNIDVSSSKIQAIDRLFNINNRLTSMFHKGQQKARHFAILPDDFFTIPLQIKNKTMFSKLVASLKKWPELVSINEMYSKPVLKIIDDYRVGSICKECFNTNKLRYYVSKDEEFLCDFGHVSDINFDYSSQYSENKILDMTKTSKKLTNSNFEFQKRNYLRKRRK